MILHKLYETLEEVHNLCYTYTISVGSPVSARWACRGSFQFWNWTTSLTATGMGFWNWALFVEVFKPGNGNSYYAQLVTVISQCAHVQSRVKKSVLSVCQSVCLSVSLSPKWSNHLSQGITECKQYLIQVKAVLFTLTFSYLIRIIGSLAHPFCF